ncbi:circularly permuted type 2 ATP-grasp protein [Burkholderia sp. L27(2015)]|uniref:circularly permuted type 2 ATP-grasp protein n=1 Tax=Burkholderia sp. L27(2015) TaxID=1641858 RepID=UPI00131DD4AB|nr:circularly permuted type 2 ATP-grasp protein [Burkholderia sp. L27(2015)]
MPSALLSSYTPHPDRYDEMLDASSAVRDHWRALWTQLNTASPEQMHQHADFVRSQIVENGVTYNTYASAQDAGRPWELDPLPLVLPASEWEPLAAAVAQRARLLDAVLADLYGPQTLLSSGLLPPAMVFGHPGFLWPCQGVQPPHGRFLHMYAVDLARSPDGRWWVIADRTQAPSGAGYALENRLIVSRVFPDLFRDLRVHHLAEFFRAQHQALSYFAPTDGETPLIVLLTPGPYNETYFEHAYLARYLGFPLVEGQDLTVRGDKVYLKTLNGLQRVHAILRRLDDGYCDPLELRGDSALGVPGLLQAVRAGQVLMANALGSSVVESTAIAAFLPNICEHLLGEPLAISSVATWWCGETPALEHVIENLDELVIKPAYPSFTFEPVFGHDLQGAQRDQFIERLRQQPHAYVAQELVTLSQAPMVSADPRQPLAARSVGLRMMATAKPDGGYSVMPGGLTRVADLGTAQMISMQRGGSSKDTWVLSEQPVSTLSLLKRVTVARDLVRSPASLSSRVVENLFWLGRYTARCDDVARLLRVALTRFDDASREAPLARAAAVDVCRWLALIPDWDEDSHEPAPDDEQALLAAIFDDQESSSLASNLANQMWAATQVRERLSLDNWLALNRMERSLAASARKMAGTRNLAEAIRSLDQLMTSCAALAGFAMDCMTRDDGWRLLIIGRHIERLAFLSSVVSRFLANLDEQPRHQGENWASFDWLLETADSIVTYRHRYRAQPELLPVLDLIVFDDTNPHGVVFQIHQLLSYLDELTKSLNQDSTEMNGVLPILLKRLTGFDLVRFEFGSRAACRDLRHLLDEITQAAWTLSDRLAMRHFTHIGEISRQTLAA